MGGRGKNQEAEAGTTDRKVPDAFLWEEESVGGACLGGGAQEEESAGDSTQLLRTFDISSEVSTLRHNSTNSTFFFFLQFYTSSLYSAKTLTPLP